MQNITKSKWQLRLAALVIFLLGAAAGALAPSAYRALVGWDRPSRQARFEHMLDRLQLTADQRSQVQQIFDETRRRLAALRNESEPRVAEIRSEADQRLQKVLTPEQWQQFQQLMKEGRDSRRRGGGGRGSRSPDDH